MDEETLKRKVDRRQLQEIIAGVAEGIVLIDPDDGIVWANETALAMHDLKKPSDLGVSAADYRDRFALTYRNNHPLTPAQYPIDRLMAGETFHDIVVEVRLVSAEETDDGWRRIHQLRGFALHDALDKVESHVLVTNDVTGRFTAEERFERAFGANPAPAIICRLSDLRYIKVNHGFLEMTAYARDDVIGRSVYEIDVLENAANKTEIIENLREGRTIPQTEATLRLPTGDTKFVVVAGQPLEVGDENCMLFTFMDLEPRRKAENALRQSEERFAKAFRLTPLPTLLSTRDNWLVLDVNEAFVATIGFNLEEIVGKTGRDLPLWTNAATFRELDREITRTGTLRNADIQLRTKSGEVIDCLVSAEAVSIHGQDCLLVVMQDITERKRSEVELIAAIEAVMQDTSWFSRSIIEKLANLKHPRQSDTRPAALSELTPREQEVLGLMCQGSSDAEIMKGLGLTRNTVRNHIARIYGKTGVHSRAGAVIWARERGFTGLSRKADKHAPGKPRKRR